MTTPTAARFPRYEPFDPALPIACVTPSEGRTIHRFFDTSPFSPSGRYIALFRLPFEDRMNRPGDPGAIVLVDLESGEERVVAETRGWEPQMGANLSWGRDDRVLTFNDVDTANWTPLLVKLDPFTGKSESIPGGVYQTSPDGRHAAAASMERMRRTQTGYGVVIPDERVPCNIGAPEDDGLFITDLETGERRLVLALSEAVRYIPELEDESLSDWHIYGFHSKWSPDGERLIFTVRRFRTGSAVDMDVMHAGRSRGVRMRFDVLTLKPDGSDVQNAVPARYWEHGGHHINWFPDSRTLSMNLGGLGEGLRFVRVGYDGTDLRPILQEVRGSGHPTVHPDGRHILTDTYAAEPTAFGDGTVPIRWIDMDTGDETVLARIGARTDPQPHGALRVDPHPAWDRTWQRIAFNGVIPGDNTRRVFVADMRDWIG